MLKNPLITTARQRLYPVAARGFTRPRLGLRMGRVAVASAKSHTTQGVPTMRTQPARYRISPSPYLFAALLILVASLAAAACGGSDETPGDDERDRPSSTDIPMASPATRRAATETGRGILPPATAAASSTSTTRSTTAAPSVTREASGTTVLTAASTPVPTVVPTLVSTETPEPTPTPARMFEGIPAFQADARTLWAIYDALDGDNWDYYGIEDRFGGHPWGQNSDWNFRPWRGVQNTSPGVHGTSPYDRVIGLQLPLGLLGELPPELGNLDRLEWLSLRGEGVTGALPPELSNLERLDRMSISRTNIEGEIPAQLGNIGRRLKELDLSHNQLEGEIPPELMKLTGLQRLDLSHNKLSGEITPEMAEYLSKLRYVDLSFNRLSGRVSRESPLLQLRGPGGEGRLTALMGNDFVFTERMVLTAIFQAVGNVTIPQGTPLNEWTGVTVDENGTVGELRIRVSEFPPEITLLTGLRVLDLSNSSLSKIPAELEMLPNLKVLNLRGNRFGSQECVPDSLKSQLDMTKSDLRGLTSCAERAAQEQQKAQEFQNRLETERDVLVALYNATGGSDWWDSTNWLSDDPVGEWFGVTTDRSGFVTGLSLYENQLVGTVPTELANLANLWSLQLFGNQLTGCLPKGQQGQLGDVKVGNLTFCP